jgi:hypothetical protein
MMNASRIRSVFIYWTIFGMTALYAILWPIATNARLNSMGWSRWWAIGFAVPWLMFYWVGRSVNNLRFFLAALTVLIASQLPLLLIKGNEATVEAPAGPPPA